MMLSKYSCEKNIAAMLCTVQQCVARIVQVSACPEFMNIECFCQFPSSFTEDGKSSFKAFLGPVCG